jgi:MFS transporter, FHS family, glucose/mannose:H+ symporter
VPHSLVELLMPDRHPSPSSSANGVTSSQTLSASPSEFSSVNPRAEWARLHVGFVYVGIVTILLGPLLPYLVRHWSLSDSQAGFLFTAEYSGGVFGNVLTGFLLPRLGFSKVMGIAFLAFALGFSFLGAGPWTFACLLIFIYGVALGLAVPSSNLRGTQLPSANTAAAVSLLNLSWGVGAVLCPLLIATLLPSLGLRGFSTSLCVLALLFAGLYYLRPIKSTAPIKQPPKRSLDVWLAKLRYAPAIPLLVLFFFYVGVETAIGGWAAAYEKRMPGMESTTWTLAPSVFYSFLLIGRGLTPLVLRRFSQMSVSAGGLLCALAGATVLTFSHVPFPLHVGAALAGLGLAPQYPLYVTWLADTFRDDSNWLGALYFASAGLGGAVIPWLVGIIAYRTSSLRVGLILPAAVIVVMIFFLLRMRSRSEPA